MSDLSERATKPFARSLFVTRQIPFPALDGARLYSQHLLRLTAAISERMDLLCVADDSAGEAKAASQGLPGNVRPQFGTTAKASVGKKLTTGLPHSALAFDTAENRALLQSLLATQPDLVVIDHIGSSWANAQALDWRAHSPAGVLWYATHNAERATRLSMLRLDGGPWRQPARTAAVLLDAWRIDRSDRRLLAAADLASAITDEDSASHRQRYGARRVVTVPPAYLGGPPASAKLTQATPRRVCLLGSFLWSVKKSNLRAFLSAGHKVFAGSGIEVVVAGVIDPDFQESLQREWPDVRFTGAVHSVRDALRDCRIGVVPEEGGGGFKLKLLDYVFNGLPVFALRHAVSGIAFRHDESAALFDSMAQLCRGVAERIDDLPYLNRLQAGALAVCRGYLPDDYDATLLYRTLREARQDRTAARPAAAE